MANTHIFLLFLLLWKNISIKSRGHLFSEEQDTETEAPLVEGVGAVLYHNGSCQGFGGRQTELEITAFSHFQYRRPGN